jgi:hypothetical protein
MFYITLDIPKELYLAKWGDKGQQFSIRCGLGSGCSGMINISMVNALAAGGFTSTFLRSFYAF